MNDLRLCIEAEVFPTEDERKVERAIKNLFPTVELRVVRVTEDRASFVGESQGIKVLSRFRDLLKRERIRAAARSMMISSLLNSCLTIHLNKQAAYAGHVSFATDPRESPLGPIKLSLECVEPHSVIKWLVETEQ